MTKKIAGMRSRMPLLQKDFTPIRPARAIERQRILVQHEEDRTHLHTLLEMSEKEKRAAQE